MILRQMGAELFRADGRTDRQTGMRKLIIAFHSFANALEMTNMQRSVF